MEAPGNTHLERGVEQLVDARHLRDEGESVVQVVNRWSPGLGEVGANERVHVVQILHPARHSRHGCRSVGDEVRGVGERDLHPEAAASSTHTHTLSPRDKAGAETPPDLLTTQHRRNQEAQSVSQSVKEGTEAPSVPVSRLPQHPRCYFYSFFAWRCYSGHRVSK